jgi:tetratricopeptide (TPR) repeat protein
LLFTAYRILLSAYWYLEKEGLMKGGSNQTLFSRGMGFLFLAYRGGKKVKTLVIGALLILSFFLIPGKVEAREEFQIEVFEAYSERGRVNLVYGNDKDAIEDFTFAIEFNPRDADSYAGRGLAYLKMGNPGAAKTDFEKAISIRPDLEKVLRPLWAASPWFFFGESKSAKIYINMDSVKVSDGILSFLTKQDNIGGALDGWTEFFNVEINCNEPLQERTVNYYTKSPDSLDVAEDKWPGYWIRVWNPIKSRLLGMK